MEAETHLPRLNQQVLDGILKRHSLTPDQTEKLKSLIDTEERLKSASVAVTRYPQIQTALEEERSRHQTELAQAAQDPALDKAKRDYDREIEEASRENEP